MSVLIWESFIVECKRNNGIMVLLNALHKTVRHKDVTIFHYVHCVSLSIFNVLTLSFSVLKISAENEKKMDIWQYSYRADFTDLDAVYGSDDGM